MADSVLNSWTDETFKDFTFDVNGTEIKVHRWLLASKSPVFHKMFTVDMKEKTNQRAIIKNSDPKTFEIFLKSFYGHKIIPMPTSLECYKLAHLYEAEELKSICLENMKSKATIDHLEALIQFKQTYMIYHKWMQAIDRICQEDSDHERKCVLNI